METERWPAARASTPSGSSAAPEIAVRIVIPGSQIQFVFACKNPTTAAVSNLCRCQSACSSPDQGEQAQPSTASAVWPGSSAGKIRFGAPSNSSEFEAPVRFDCFLDALTAFCSWCFSLHVRV